MRKSTFLFLLWASLLLIVTACRQEGKSGNQAQFTSGTQLDRAVDSTIRASFQTQDVEQTYQLIDSFLNAGKMSPVWADMMRASTQFFHQDFPAGNDYMRKVVEACAESGQEPVLYGRAAATYSNFLEVNDRFEEALRVALPAITALEDNPYVQPLVKGSLLINIGDCQLALYRVEEAAKSFEQAFLYFKMCQNDSVRMRDFQSAIISVGNIAVAYHQLHILDEKLKWTNRCDSMLAWYCSRPGVDSAFIDDKRGEISLARAEILLKQQKPAEAALAYEQFLKTSYSKTDDGRFSSTSYLGSIGRNTEVADIFKDLDRMAAEWELEPNLEVLCDYYYPKFHYNYLVGRKDTALAVAVKIDTLIRRAVEQYKNGETAKLATIYETQKKEAQISRQQAQLSEQRLWTAIIVFALITVFFIIYTVHRRRAAKRLAEMKAEQERIESELRIARNIQMSMVPSVFPERDGLDMYASMTPAKEVGGDLYGYLLLGDNLYFCVGDVSGKGVPASLFMAQATRLFLTLAKQQMMPDEICTRMNDALSGKDNENNMFVTFFLGLVNLSTGHLDFCNAGHNPPVLNSDFMQIVPNTPIGIFPGLTYKGEEIDNIKGQTLFVYTDGLNEAENRLNEQFGDDRLLEILRTESQDSARLLVDILKADVERHRDGAEPNDDLTMLCLKVN